MEEVFKFKFSSFCNYSVRCFVFCKVIRVKSAKNQLIFSFTKILFCERKLKINMGKPQVSIFSETCVIYMADFDWSRT